MQTLATDKDRKENMMKLKDEALQKKMEGCTFKPELTSNTKYSKVQSMYRSDQSVLDNIKAAQKKRDLHTEQLRK